MCIYIYISIHYVYINTYIYTLYIYIYTSMIYNYIFIYTPNVYVYIYILYIVYIYTYAHLLAHLGIVQPSGRKICCKGWILRDGSKIISGSWSGSWLSGIGDVWNDHPIIFIKKHNV